MCEGESEDVTTTREKRERRERREKREEKSVSSNSTRPPTTPRPPRAEDLLLDLLLHQQHHHEGGERTGAHTRSVGERRTRDKREVKGKRREWSRATTTRDQLLKSISESEDLHY